MKWKLLKLVSIVLVSVAVLALAAVAIVFLRRDELVRSFSPSFERFLGEKLGVEARFGEVKLVNVLLRPRMAVAFRIDDLSLEGGERGSVRAEQVLVGLDPWALLSQRIDLSVLEIRSPIVKIGNLPPGSREESGAPPGEPSEGEGEVNLERLAVSGGSLQLANGFVVSDVEISARLSARRNLVEVGELRVGFGMPTSDRFRLAAREALYRGEPGRIEVAGAKIESSWLGLEGEARYDLGSGDWKAAVGQGALRLDRVNDLIGLFAPSAVSVTGTVEPALDLAGRGGRILHASGRVELAGVSVDAAGLALRDLNGVAQVDTENGDIVTSLRGAKARIDGLAAPIELEGSSRGLGEAALSIEARGAELRELIATLGRFGVAGVPDSAGPVDVSSKLAFSGGGLSDLSIVSEIGGAAVPRFELRDVRGPLTLRRSGRRFVIESKGLSARAGPGQRSLRVSGSYDVNAHAGSGSLEGSSLDAAWVRKIAALEPQLEGRLSPKLTFSISDAGIRRMDGTIGLEGIGSEAGGISIRKATGEIRIRPLRDDVTSFAADGLKLEIMGEELSSDVSGELRGGVITFKGSKGKALGGSMSMEGRIATAGRTRDWSGRVTLAGADAGRLAELIDPGTGRTVRGRVSLLEIRADDSGKRSEGRVELVEGALIGVNLGRMALERVKGIPFISGALYREVPAELRPHFESNDTSIRRFTAVFESREGRLTARDVQFRSDDFVIEGQGRMDEGGRIEARGDITFSPIVSGALVRKVRELGALLNRSGSMSFPLSIGGRLSDLSVSPDLGTIAARVARRAAEGKAGELLERALGGERGEPIGNILEGILRRPREPRPSDPPR